MMYCIETNNLQYGYANREPVLKGLDIQVPFGTIYGFLGPNGAGKTTTLRLLLGLLTQQGQSAVKLFGLPVALHRLPVLRRTGSLIESPSLYLHLNAVDNLRVWQNSYRCPDRRIAEVLDLVGLSGTGNKKVGVFSLGMKQRLGIAIALLHEPELLILDEPTNGLDPNGIIEMRALLQHLNQELRMTIVVSSHLLPEIEKLATHVGIINGGKLLFQGTLAALRSRQQSSTQIVLDTNDPDLVMRLIEYQHPVSVNDEGLVTVNGMSRGEVAAWNRRLVQQGIDVYRIGIQHNDLESMFMNLINP